MFPSHDRVGAYKFEEGGFVRVRPKAVTADGGLKYFEMVGFENPDKVYIKKDHATKQTSST